MLRKGAPGTGAAPKKRYDYDEKGGKMKRQSRQRVTSTLLVLFLFGFISMGALYVFKDSTDFDPLGPGVQYLRSRVLKRTKFFRNPSMLPPDSIYHLAELQDKYADRGFTVLAFPTNDFHQERGTNEEIQLFVKEEFPQVNFPIFGKSSLAANPVYLKFQRQLPNSYVRHNFFKYLVNRKGIAVEMFDKKTEPLSLADAIEKLLEDDVPKKLTTQ
ncbi:Probable phospholipid hydroperoxide glutathione peroxidase [Seminavis robusta]|uniref:Probable phospholipid hydroperoxide glutathione peroxidase n=1 Tax=Seminavis robusta TaxID=568900 RepID=A0A9N8DLF1_9STRA|nr:Probable phospholipid hydroperoxide glutathione peroxidase [Seminavis robusta]|eukprot:Sro196_g083510.1 Probable phospholipid hydroperoxide glutathione peroxidase (215) ;mRNA; r:48820-49581